ncbi:MAG: twin-arginine translocase TatA/TatE family subunit [Ktedonobacteraceae bacterium]|nr:twin-arginine translocase TatA/TatE family subunit [Ktedonobacteraceae bacterium]
MGFHYVELLVILLIGLAIFGPKTLQSVSRSIGKGAGQAKTMKDNVMAELPMEEISRVSQHIPRIPLNSQQAIQMLLTPEKAGAARDVQPETKDAQRSAPPSLS